MLRSLLLSATLMFASVTAIADEALDDATDEATDEATQETQPATAQGDGIEKPKTMSGMSILGNEEAPKSLVIIPWKSSELGDDIKLSDTLDDRARPVDKEVFLRELGFYLIRSGK
ncbi:MAG: hypothetical protein OER80_02930 [Gammaproteobacteria bacterium]|nr:hypothetical protein [Gammaproteobacteria bacterium]MDH3767159.1 hypothetical protein [Gammaproteobacteria bacterium]